MKTIDNDTKGHQIFINKGIDSVGNPIHTKYDIYQSQVEKPHPKFFMDNIDQIFFFQQLHHTNFTNTPTTTDSNILYNFTKEKQDKPFNFYISKNLHNPYPCHICIGYLPYIGNPAIKLAI